MTGLQRIRTALTVALSIIFAGNVSTASGQGLITDRPDFTESAVTVPAGMLQFEGGATYSEVTEDLSEFVGGEALLRWGVHEQVEVRIGAPSIISLSNGDTHSGISDGSLGAKVQLGPVGSGWDLGVIGSLSMPIGDEEFSSDKVDPTVIVTAGRDVNERISVGGQLIASWPTLGDEREFEWGGTFVAATPLSSRAGGFVELALTVPESGTAPLVGHTGVVYGVSDTFQLDIHTGIGLTDTAPDFFIGAGLAAAVR